MNNRLLYKAINGFFLYVISILYLSCGNNDSIVPELVEIGGCLWMFSSLKTIVIPDKVTVLLSGVFSLCFSLEKVWLGAGLKKINAAFVY